ncbi:MAG: hypothetical protein HW419_909 [Deltaproteobacteria bacterium]|nr:hypothetical protein [Deltaproteobacteria bacterium]
MSNLLLIEPDRMLQQAFTLALCPEHRLKVLDAIPDAAPKDFDVVIVDAAALQSEGAGGARALHALLAWKSPIIWIGEAQARLAADREKIVRLSRPLEKSALQGALAQCLGKTSAPKRDTMSAEPPIKTPVLTQAKAKRKANPAPSHSGQFIELVDVVEEASASEIAETK